MKATRQQHNNVRTRIDSPGRMLSASRNVPSRLSRRGVASILAMMFLVIFGSLAAAMAVVAQGNLRTADSHMKVSRAMSAAESGLTFAARRLARESQRFVVDKGVIDWDFAHALWTGNINPDIHGTVTVLPPQGYSESQLPSGIVYAVRNAHLADSHNFVVEPGDENLPLVNEQTGTLIAPPIVLSNMDPPENGPYFRLRYQLLEDEPAIRVTSQGFDGGIRRTLQLDFRVEKRIEYAILSPNRIMIGKNVRVEGPIGSLYGVENPSDLEVAHGHPLIMRSDFYYLDPSLDQKLDTLYEAVALYDVDGDGRLRPNHPVEQQGILMAPDILIDYTGDGYVTDFDLFMAHYDTSGDGRVVYDADLAAAAGYGGLSVEFDADLQLARLIDEYMPDRAGDGIPGTSFDTALGWRDGIIDARDMYAKVHGRLRFGVSREEWENAQGINYQEEVMGPIDSDIDIAPVEFEVGEPDIREITTDMFNDSMNWFSDRTTGTPSFESQVTAQGGVYPSPVMEWEEVAYQSAGAYDHFERPVYENMTFENVRIPMGTNALFINCTFIGVTYVETYEQNSHVNWNYVGTMDKIEYPPGSGQFTYVPKFAGEHATLGDGTEVYDTKPYSNNIRFHDCTFIGSVSGDKPVQYTHWRNKLQYTGHTRFYLDPDDHDLHEQPDGDEILAIIESFDEEDFNEMMKSSILAPGWSINVGSFINEQGANPEDTPRIKLRGTIVAGILDVRGTADVFGTLLMTFRPVMGEGPLYYGGVPAAFNTTIGYFGPGDGDFEGVDPGDATFDGFGEITLRYDPDTKLPDGIPWPVSIRAIELTYSEGGMK